MIFLCDFFLVVFDSCNSYLKSQATKKISTAPLDISVKLQMLK